LTAVIVADFDTLPDFDIVPCADATSDVTQNIISSKRGIQNRGFINCLQSTSPETGGFAVTPA
jgi:hypothetical protein